jgi:cell wall-associated NlpC family hydrolase
MPRIRNRPWSFRRLAHRGSLRLLALGALAAGVLGAGLTGTSAGDLQGQITATRSAAASLQSQIAADSQQIAHTTAGLHQAEAQLASVQVDLNRRVDELRVVQTQLIAARDHLVALENRLHLAVTALAANLRASYEGAQPDLMTVILQSHGFNSLLEQVNFMAKVGHQDARIVGLTRTARAEVAREANHLSTLESRDRVLADAVLARRNQAAALQSALMIERLHQIGARGRVGARYHSLRDHLQSLEKRAAAQAARAAATGNAGVGGVAVNTGGMVQPPAGAPAAVAQVIAAGNAIAGLPYIWGGGHGSFQASGYDCSGSVSYALAAAGLLNSPLDSTGFESWGDPGPGRWITVYANAGHAFMIIDGWRFDTVALAEGGTRWSSNLSGEDTFVVRHPPGL